MSRSMHQAEGSNGGATVAVAGRHQVGDHVERLGLRAAVRFAQGACRSAEPRPPHRISHQREQRIVELQARDWHAPGSDWTQSIVFSLQILILVFRPEGPLREKTPEGGSR